jgi:ERCC4-type nuclease|tara:strand:- start:1312 stop:2067 length:756 start_codon:yes stop_codon:yes gene_type:complete
MEIIIDNRETKIKDYFLKKPDVDKLFKYENLDIGDIIIKYNGNIHYIFERKTISDLSDSIKDNRYHEQKQRMLHAYDNNIKICYIFEYFKGYIGLNKDLQINSLRGDILLSAMLNTALCNDFGTFTTINTNETIFILEELVNRMLKNPDKYFNKTNQIDNSFLLKKRKKDNITRDNILILYLCQIPGVSTSISEELNKKFKTMNNLITELNKYDTDLNKIEYLANITITIKNNKTRRIGNKTANKIIELLF